MRLALSFFVLIAVTVVHTISYSEPGDLDPVENPADVFATEDPMSETDVSSNIDDFLGESTEILKQVESIWALIQDSTPSFLDDTAISDKPGS